MCVTHTTCKMAQKKSTIFTRWKIVKNYNRWFFFFLILALVSNLYASHFVEKALECIGYIRWIIMVFCMLNLEYLNEGWRGRSEKKVRNKQEKKVRKTERMEKKGWIWWKKKRTTESKNLFSFEETTWRLSHEKKSWKKKVHIAGKWSLYIYHVYTAWAKKKTFICLTLLFLLAFFQYADPRTNAGILWRQEAFVDFLRYFYFFHQHPPILNFYPSPCVMTRKNGFLFFNTQLTPDGLFFHLFFCLILVIAAVFFLFGSWILV